MAKFLTSLINSGDVKQGLEKGSQGIAHAAVGLVEQFATRGVIGKILPGVGLVNPLLGIFTEEAVSAVKAQLLSVVTVPTENLNMVGATSANPDESVVLEEKKYSPETFGTLRGPENSAAVLATPAMTTPALAQEAQSTIVQPSVLHPSTEPQLKGPQKFTPTPNDGMHTMGKAGLSDTPGTMDEQKVGEISELSEGYVPEKFGAGRGSETGTSTVMGDPAQATAGLFADQRQGLRKLTINNWGINHPGTDPMFEHIRKDNQPTNFAKFNDNNGNPIVENNGIMKASPVDTAAANPSVLSSPDLEKPVRKGTTLAKQSGLAAQFSDDPEFITVQRPNSLKDVKRFVDPRSDSISGSSTKRKPMQEFLQQHRFVIIDSTNDDVSVFDYAGGEQNFLAAGFASCDSPTITVETFDIKEGTWEFPRQIIRSVQPSRMMLTKGIVQTKTEFYLWIVNYLRGNILRRTLDIFSYGRQLVAFQRDQQGFQLKDGSPRNEMARWRLHNVAPTRYQAGQGWDARTGEIQVAELEISYEWFEELRAPGFNS